MDITGMDITILVASTVGIILMSLAFPALGLTGDAASTNEVPEFSVETNAFDFTGDFPSRPSGPSGGTLVFVGNLDGNPGSGLTDNDKWLKGGTNNGQFIYILGEGNNSNPEAFIEMQDWDNDNVTEEDNVTLTEEGQQATLSTTQDTDWMAFVELDRVYSSGENQTTLEVSYEIEHDENEDGAWYSGIPIVSDTAEGIQWLGRTLIYIGNVFRWGILTLVELIWNVTFLVIELSTYMIELLSFLTSTYGDVTTNNSLAPWAQLILLIPGVLFAVELAKLIAVITNVIWI